MLTENLGLIPEAFPIFRVWGSIWVSSVKFRVEFGSYFGTASTVSGRAWPFGRNRGRLGWCLGSIKGAVSASVGGFGDMSGTIAGAFWENG
jgi:hypothetical protein